MKVSACALAALIAFGTSNAFVVPEFGKARPASTAFHSLAPPASTGQSKEGRSEDEIKAEVSAGKILEGGKVIDFEAIKGPSSAEQALENAKHEIINSKEKYVPPGTGILGINEDVVSLVGHGLGNFATSEEIQGAAAYLRSQALSSLFEKREESVNGSSLPFYPDDNNARFNDVLRKAYVESGEVTSAFAKTFYMGTQLLPEAPREAIWAIYVWCRRTDEIVDAPRDNDAEMLNDLGSWEMRLENLWKYGDVEDVYDLCLLDVLVKYPTLPITPFMDMIRGMLMDVPKLGQDRYETFDELHLYCYRVAGTVGLMSLPVFGCSPGYNDVIAK
jgi:phytoene synthase